VAWAQIPHLQCAGRFQPRGAKDRDRHQPASARVVRALTALVEVRGKPLDFPEFVQDDMINILDHFAPESRD